MRFLLVGLMVVASCKEKPRQELDAARDPVLVVVDATPEVEHGPDIADAVASLEAMEETGVVDAGPAVEASFGVAKVTPKGALDPASVLSRHRFRFRACGRSLPDAGSSKVVLTLKVGEGGEVSTVTATDKGPLGDCLRDAAKHVRFEEPTGGSATVEVPVEVIRR